MDKNGFTLVEMLITFAIMSLMLAGGYAILATGQSAWFASEGNIRLQESLRQSVQRVIMELRQTQMGRMTIFDGIGEGNTDVVRFSLPVVCESGGSLIDVNGDVAHWGAPLTWGCVDASCMDADNDCDTLDYRAVEYRVNASRRLVRRVLNSSLATVREDIVAEGIGDFQLSSSGSVVQYTIGVNQKTALNRSMNDQLQGVVYLRN